MGRANYIGFYIDWSIEAIGSTSSYIILITSDLIYIGVFLYVDAMVKDMQIRIKSSDFSDQMNSWTMYVREMNFHIEIIR